MAPSIPNFEQQRVKVADGVTLNVAVGGAGRPLVLLHGFPQTHLMWRHVAADLAADHTVICPDLRGYGASDRPAIAARLATCGAPGFSAKGASATWPSAISPSNPSIVTALPS